MSCVTRFQILQGTTAQRLAFTPLLSEFVYDTDLNAVFVGDGVTLGGLPIAVTGADWLKTGNASTGGGTDSGFVLGTTTDNSWSFIVNNIVRGGFSTDGYQKLKSHQNYTGSDLIMGTAGVQTTNATPTTIFTLPITDQFVGRISYSVQGRKSDGSEWAIFERSALVRREGGGALVSSKVHAHFTEKSQELYDSAISPSGNDVLVTVTGKALETINWSGHFKWQMIGSNT